MAARKFIFPCMHWIRNDAVSVHFSATHPPRKSPRCARQGHECAIYFSLTTLNTDTHTHSLSSHTKPPLSLLFRLPPSSLNFFVSLCLCWLEKSTLRSSWFLFFGVKILYPKKWFAFSSLFHWFYPKFIILDRPYLEDSDSFHPPPPEKSG